MKEQITDLNQLIKKYKSTIESLQEQINETTEKMNVAYRALQLLQQEGVSQSVLPLSVPESISEKYKNISMNKAIFDVLSNAEKYLNGQEIYDELIKNGFKSGSSNIKRDVYIALYKLLNENKLVSRKHENRKKYMIKQNT